MTTHESSSSRLMSLDAFRGATVAGMILVNNPGTWAAVYPQLAHSRWNGWTFTDMIFPFFLWIVGVAIHFAFTKRLQKGATKGRLLGHAFFRALIIFGIGLFLNGFAFGLLGDQFSFATWRIPGVLQRIAVCYFIASAIYLWTGTRMEIMWTVGLFVVYWLASMLIPVPESGRGILEPSGSLAWYIDSNLLAGHTWVWAPAPGFDPEGILSTLPAIGTTLMGVLTGRWLQGPHTKEEKTAWMFVTGNALLLLGVILDIWMPINKNLWTPSFSIFMCGWALVCLAIFYWLIDVKGHSAWSKPFVMFGVNAIAVYALAEILAILSGILKVTGSDGTRISVQEWIFKSWFLPFASPINASLAYAIFFDLVMLLFVWALWSRKVVIKV